MRKTLDVITQEMFDELLAWLDPNREVAGRKYEEIRRSLVKVFAWRKCSDAEGMADCAINRVAHKVRELRPNYEGNPVRYFHGVAKNVLKEYQKGVELEVSLTNFEMPDDHPVADRADLERADACLRLCLEGLGSKQRRQIVTYYGHEKSEKIRRRRELAERMGIEQNALRVRMHRLRAVLEKCMKQCMAESAEKEIEWINNHRRRR
jgi:RNA polymerase sigma factor (sigma-70 family)